MMWREGILVYYCWIFKLGNSLSKTLMIELPYNPVLFCKCSD